MQDTFCALVQQHVASKPGMTVIKRGWGRLHIAGRVLPLHYTKQYNTILAYTMMPPRGARANMPPAMQFTQMETPYCMAMQFFHLLAMSNLTTHKTSIVVYSGLRESTS